jgi:hypothetical protein
MFLRGNRFLDGGEEIDKGKENEIVTAKESRN